MMLVKMKPESLVTACEFPDNVPRVFAPITWQISSFSLGDPGIIFYFCCAAQQSKTVPSSVFFGSCDRTCFCIIKKLGPINYVAQSLQWLCLLAYDNMRMRIVDKFQ